MGWKQHTTYRLTCQLQPSSVSLVLLASESPLRFQSLFPTPFSPRHYQQRRGSVQQQKQRLWATLRTISCRSVEKTNGTKQLRRKAKTTNVLHTSPGLKRGVAYFLPNPQGNDPFKSSTLLIVHRHAACNSSGKFVREVATMLNFTSDCYWWNRKLP